MQQLPAMERVFKKALVLEVLRHLRPFSELTQEDLRTSLLNNFAVKEYAAGAALAQAGAPATTFTLVRHGVVALSNPAGQVRRPAQPITRQHKRYDKDVLIFEFIHKRWMNSVSYTLNNHLSYS